MDERKISLGQTDVQVSPLGIGTWAWGDRLMWGFGKGYTESDLRGAFDACIDAGIGFFDTAEIYGLGRSERFLAKFIRESNQAVVVATKFFPFPWRLRSKSIVEALARSLERLGLKQVDLYQIHWPYPPIGVETWMEGMANAVEAGLTRAVGVSNYGAEQTRRAHAALARRNIPLASNQIEYSLLQRSPEKNGLIETCRELGVSIIAYSPLAKGLLTGKYTPGRPPPGIRGRTTGHQYLARIQPLIALLQRMGEMYAGKTPAQVALNWLLCQGVVPIPGAKNASQATENAGALGWRLTESEVAALDVLSDQIHK